MKKICAVICGAVRQEFELYNMLSLLCEWRSQGLISQIILSTWKNELENIRGFRGKCKSLGITVIESAPYDDEWNKLVTLSYLRQVTQLNAALSAIPEDYWILKCRTDFCIDIVMEIKNVFEKELKTKSFGILNPLCNYKISVYRFRMIEPFWFCDLAFFAHKTDIIKMISFENPEKFTKTPTMLDECFFINPFLHYYPIISFFYRLVDLKVFYKNFGKNIRNRFKDFPNGELYFPSILNKFFSLYIVIFYQNFHICYEGEYPKKEHKFEDFFLFDYSVAARRYNGVLGFFEYGIFNLDLFSEAVSGKMKKTNGYEAFYSEIEMIRNNKNYISNNNISYKDYLEMAEWGEKYLGLQAKEWLRWEEVNETNDYKKISGLEANKILFSDYRLKDNQIRAISEIPQKMIKNKKSYCDAVADLIPAISENDLCDLIRATSAQTCNHSRMITLLQRMYRGEVRESTVKILEGWIRRFNIWGLFINSRLECDGIVALYWYGKYREKIGKVCFLAIIMKLSLLWDIKYKTSNANDDGDEFIQFLNESLRQFRERKNSKMENEILDAIEVIMEAS